MIGAIFDTKMPAWSYGNRLYLHWWKDKTDKWQIGNYRNSTPSLYRNWNQSWPQMKKRITVSLKRMAFTGDLDEEEENVLEQERQISLDYAKLKYLEEGYFNQFQDKPVNTLFWIGLDLSKFYPHVSITKTKNIIIKDLKAEQDERFINLMNALCAFELDVSDYVDKEEDLKRMGLENYDVVSFEQLPTGLLVSGFLANVFMLDIDRQADSYLDLHHDVIHFRYVDDHVIIGRTPNALKQWVEQYINLLTESGLEINEEKAEPKGVLVPSDNGYIVDENKLVEDGEIDAFYPTPLMTQTLQKVSLLSKEKLPLLSGSEFNLVFKDLQTMLVTDIPETEIKKATRISFACTMLSRMMRDGHVDYHEVYLTRRNLYESINYDKQRSDERKKELIPLLFRESFALSKEEKEKLSENETNAFNHLKRLIEKGNRKTDSLAKNIFGLLMRSLNEVPDKVKIWVRAFLFSVNHYPDGISKLRYQLKKTEAQNNLHHLSVLYLESIIEFLSAEAILDILGHLYKNEYATSSEKERDKKALQLLLEPPFPDEGFHFKELSSLALKKAQNEYQNSCNTLGLPSIEAFVVPGEIYDYPDGLTLDATFWELWKLDVLEDYHSSCDNEPKCLVNKQFVATDSPYYEGYVYKVLSLLEEYKQDDIFLFPENNNASKVSKELQYAMRMFDKKGEFFALQEKDRPHYQDLLSLYEWIRLTRAEMSTLLRTENAYYRKEASNKVQYHEIFSVKLMLEIAKKTKVVMGEGVRNWDNKRLHPMNIYLKEDMLKEPQWSLVLDNIDIPVTLMNDDVEGAETYYETKNTAPVNLPVNFTVCYSLGLNFLHLLTRMMYFPWIMNNPNYGYEWRKELNKILNKGEVSSINYKITEACLSMWNRENVYLRMSLGDDLFREEQSQSIEILGIDDMISWLERSLHELRNNLISVPDHQYRQLIEITVD